MKRRGFIATVAAVVAAQDKEQKDRPVPVKWLWRPGEIGRPTAWIDQYDVIHHRQNPSTLDGVDGSHLDRQNISGYNALSMIRFAANPTPATAGGTGAPTATGMWPGAGGIRDDW